MGKYDPQSRKKADSKSKTAQIYLADKDFKPNHVK